MVLWLARGVDRRAGARPRVHAAHRREHQRLPGGDGPAGRDRARDHRSGRGPGPVGVALSRSPWRSSSSGIADVVRPAPPSPGGRGYRRSLGDRSVGGWLRAHRPRELGIAGLAVITFPRALAGRGARISPCWQLRLQALWLIGVERAPGATPRSPRRAAGRGSPLTLGFGLDRTTDVRPHDPADLAVGGSPGIFDADLRVDEETGVLEPRYNVAPTDPLTVVLERGDEGRVVEQHRWGLDPLVLEISQAPVPSASTPARRPWTTSPAFRASFRSRRCIVPFRRLLRVASSGPGQAALVPSSSSWRGHGDGRPLGRLEGPPDRTLGAVRGGRHDEREPPRVVRHPRPDAGVSCHARPWDDWLDRSVDDEEYLLSLLEPGPPDDVLEIYPNLLNKVERMRPRPGSQEFTDPRRSTDRRRRRPFPMGSRPAPAAR